MPERRPRTGERTAARAVEDGTEDRPVPATTARSTPEGRIDTSSLLPNGASTTLDVDVSGQLQTVAPSFGTVLTSIGNGVAASQAALDQGIVDTVNALKDTKIKVVTDVVQGLDDDGLPDMEKSKLVTTDVSVLNFFTPTVHEWKHVALSMDLYVGAFDNEQGVSFSRRQNTSNVTGVGLLWGFVGWFDTESTETTSTFDRTTRQEGSWSQGEVRVDALLGPRTTSKFPVPADISIGPQIFFSQGAVTEAPAPTGGTKRSVDITITVRKASGDENPNLSLEFDPGVLQPSFSTTAPFTGSTTNADGQCKVTLSRNLPAGFGNPRKTPISVRLNQVSKSFVVTL
jgi:hypothetical protein